MSSPVQYSTNRIESIPEGNARLALVIGEQDCSLAISSLDGELLNLQQNFRQHNFSRNAMLSQLLGKNQTLLSRQFAHVSVQIKDDAFTLLPQEISKAERLSQLIDNPSKKEIKVVPLDDKYALSYAVDKDILSILENTFYKFTLSHTSASLYTNATDAEADALAVIGKQSLDLAVLNQGEVSSITSHKAYSTEDFTYFILLALDAVEKDKASCCIKLSGEVDQSSEIYKTLYKYVGKVELYNPSLGAKPITDFDISERYHYHLLTLLNENN